MRRLRESPPPTSASPPVTANTTTVAVFSASVGQARRSSMAEAPATAPIAARIANSFPEYTETLGGSNVRSDKSSSTGRDRIRDNSILMPHNSQHDFD